MTISIRYAVRLCLHTDNEIWNMERHIILKFLIKKNTTFTCSEDEVTPFILTMRLGIWIDTQYRSFYINTNLLAIKMK